MKKSNPFARQSFLGPNSQDIIETCIVGIIGLGGGGSHIAQQLAHLGFLNYVLFDKDRIEDTNLNRLIGGTQRDVEKRTLKIDIACRLIKQIRPKANVEVVEDIWQNRANALKRCDIVFGGVDGFDQRRQLESATRRFLIPLIDIGMDVVIPPDGVSAIGGQVILSMPGEPCMTCLGFLNDQSLAREAARYGDAGDHPQVVWTNGVLSSTAVGIAVDLLTDWSRSTRQRVYLCYRGSSGTLTPHVHLEYLGKDPCPHFPLENCGAPQFRPL
jgi:molybdopterin-synthase adenylyltransferase